MRCNGGTPMRKKETSKMPKGRLVYFERWADPVAEEIIGREDNIDMRRLTYDAPEDDNWQALSQTHIYQIKSARDELAPQYHANEALLARCPNLLAVSSWGAGYDTVDVEACSKAGVIVVSQAGGNKEAVAEHALGMMLAVSKRIGETDKAMRRKAEFDRQQFIGHNIEGMTLGIVGLGNIGRRVAELARGLFRMRVLAYDPYLPSTAFTAAGAEEVPFAELLAESDIVTVHCPRNAETMDMLDADAFGRMKQGAIYVNTARGGIHNEDALYQALSSGRLYGAGIDVWSVEPPDPQHPLLSLDNVLASPHTAGVTHESRKQVAIFAAEQVIDIFAGRRPPRLVNPDVWPVFQERYKAAFG
jgi:D-3-phosphoglycerate dehydrogenase